MLYTVFALLGVLTTINAAIHVPLRSNGKDYVISFLVTTPLSEVTRDFCVQNAASLGIAPLTETSLHACQEPVAAHIQSYVQSALATEPTIQEVIPIQLEIGGRLYDLRFHPTAESILSVSRDFCITNAASLGIEPLTESSLPGCQGPVLEHMRAVALKFLEEKKDATTAPSDTTQIQPIQTVLTIMNQKVPFEVYPTESSILSVSRDFCINNQNELGIAPLSEETLPTCQQPLVDALVQAVRNDAVSKQIAEIKVNIGDNSYLVRFRPAVETVSQVARDFCITNAASLGLAQLTEETLSGCRDPVAQYLQAQLQSTA